MKAWTDKECQELLRRVGLFPQGQKAIIAHSIIRAAVEEAKLEQAEKDAKISETIGCVGREVSALGSTKRIPGCGTEIAFAIRQEAAILARDKEPRE